MVYSLLRIHSLDSTQGSRLNFGGILVRTCFFFMCGRSAIGGEKLETNRRSQGLKFCLRGVEWWTSLAGERRRVSPTVNPPHRGGGVVVRGAKLRARRLTHELERRKRFQIMVFKRSETFGFEYTSMYAFQNS